MIDTSRIKTIFFDLDHTLWDFEKNSALTFEKIFSAAEVDVPLDAFLNAYVPINHQYWKLYRDNQITQEELRLLRLQKTFEQLGLQFQPAELSHFSTQYIQYLCTFTHLFEGTVELLTHLRPSFDLHLITNGFDEVQHFKVSNSDLSQYFGQIFTAEKVGYKKPHPKIFAHALEQTATLPEHALMIGDSLEADILGAQDMGMQAIHFNSHNEPLHKHCLIVNSLAEIKALL
jgi:putative hydrolase of the HAD superfamily